MQVSISKIESGLPLLESFTSILDFARYWTPPDDWSLYICDLRNSTIAIEKGRYKEVNTVGASAIMAVMNSVKPEEVFAVFGGDGATILCPPESIDATSRALLGVQKLAKESFSLDLRIARIPLLDLRVGGAPVRAALVRVSRHISQVAFAGPGVAMAEHWAKTPPAGRSYAVYSASFVPPADLTGLECRWSPVKSERGKMVSLLVQSLSPTMEGAAKDYREILQAVDTVVSGKANPISKRRLSLSFRFSELFIEAKARRASGNFFSRLWYTTKIFSVTHLFNVLWKSLLWRSGTRYKKELVDNSDYRKFDGILRMVLDLNSTQMQLLTALFQTKAANGQIVYGVHQSDSAIVTCLILNRSSGQHLHFVDGSDGGYCAAARQMKQQLAGLKARPTLRSVK